MAILNKFGEEIRPLRLSGAGRDIRNPQEIIAKIAHSFRDRSRKDIAKWRTAIQIAEDKEKPRRDFLMDLYHDLYTDGHLQSQLMLRKSATMNTAFHIISKGSGDIDEEKTDFIQSQWFYSTMDWYFGSIFEGHSLIELTGIIEGIPTLGLVPRKNVVPNKGYVIPDLSKADEVIRYKDEPALEKWILEQGDPLNFGVMNTIVPNLIWKRNVMQSWAEFCERFGIPMVTATTLRNDDKELDHVENMLQQLGEAAYAVFPKDTEIKFIEPSGGSKIDIFDNKIERNNSEISKAIIGGDMITDNGSSRSQSEVHERNLEERIAAMDRRNFTFWVNNRLIPLLNEHGFGFSDDHRFTFDSSPQLEVKEHWDIAAGLMQNGYELEESWLAKTFNVPIVGKKKVQPQPPK